MTLSAMALTELGKRNAVVLIAIYWTSVLNIQSHLNNTKLPFLGDLMPKFRVRRLMSLVHVTSVQYWL